MMVFITGITAAIAAGCLIVYAVALTIKWLKNKIKEKLAQKNVSKVATADLETLIDECENTMSMEEFEKFVDEGYTHVMASVDDNGKVYDVEVIKDTNDSVDEEVEQLLRKEGMVVIEK